MRRTDRLFEILQMFRERGFLRATDMAERLEVSQRTIYRDLDTLIASGHPIEGERGVGYLLREPLFLPPLQLTAAEASTLRLGMDLVRSVSDADMADQAEAILNKLSPKSQKTGISLYGEAQPVPHIAALRDAVDRRERIALTYARPDAMPSQRTVQPLQLEYWQTVWTLTGWCELRDDFRTFRVDRIVSVSLTGDIFPDAPEKSYAAYLDLMKGERLA